MKNVKYNSLLTLFIPLPSNSHKIEGLIKWSGLPIKVCKSVKEIEEQIIWSLDNKPIFQEFQDFLFNQKYFTSETIEKSILTIFKILHFFDMFRLSCKVNVSDLTSKIV